MVYSNSKINSKSFCANPENGETKRIVSSAQKLSPVVNKCKIEILTRAQLNNIEIILNMIPLFRIFFIMLLFLFWLLSGGHKLLMALEGSLGGWRGLKDMQGVEKMRGEEGYKTWEGKMGEREMGAKMRELMCNGICR